MLVRRRLSAIEYWVVPTIYQHQTTKEDIIDLRFLRSEFVSEKNILYGNHYYFTLKLYVSMILLKEEERLLKMKFPSTKSCTGSSGEISRLD